MISFSVVVTASLSESECKGRKFWDYGKMFGRFFFGFRDFSMNSDMFWAVRFGFTGISGNLGRLGGEGEKEGISQRCKQLQENNEPQPSYIYKILP